MGRKGETVSYSPPSFEECYSKKLNELKVQLKGVLYGDTPFVVSQEYACKKEISREPERKCSGRVHIHTQAGKWLCLLCALRLGGQAPRWSKETRAKIEEIMQGYPDQQQCLEEWQAKQPRRYVQVPQEPRMAQTQLEEKTLDKGKVEFGQRMKAARKAKELTIDQLAVQIIKEKRKESLSSSAIQMYESGSVYPPEYILKQLVKILGSQILEEKKVEEAVQV
jgi:ribosome-binding protein aMBF1 (putative translation factor)